jgi:hypothetical protein
LLALLRINRSWCAKAAELPPRHDGASHVAKI